MRVRDRTAAGVSATAGFVAVVAAVFVVGMYLNFSMGGGTPSTTSTTTTSGSGLQGVVTGYVTVGPSQPVCPVDTSCNENMTGYSVVFTPECTGASNCDAKVAELSPSGHYSILLPAGNYTVTGLRPSCDWMGCASAFPRTVVVDGGMQLVFNIDIDTGIR